MTESDETNFDTAASLPSASELAASGMTMLENGVLLRVHPPTAREGRHCWVHNPTPSHMVRWPVRWRAEKSTAERVCTHGIGHPDPDDVKYNQNLGRDVSIHGCDGCCWPPAAPGN